MAREISTLKCRRTPRIDQAAKPHGVKELRFVDVSDLTIDLLDMILVLFPKLGDGYNCNF